MIHSCQEENHQPEQRRDQGRHPEVHPLIVQVKTPRHGDIDPCANQNESPQRTRKACCYAQQAGSPVLDEFIELTIGLLVQLSLPVRGRLKGGKIICKDGNRYEVARWHNASPLLRPRCVNHLPGIVPQIVLQEMAIWIRVVADIEIERRENPGFAINLSLGFCESRPDADHEQSERDAIEDGNGTEIISHNVVVREGSVMERGHPSSGYRQPCHSECAEYKYRESAEQPIRQVIDPEHNEASPGAQAHLPHRFELGRTGQRAEVETRTSRSNPSPDTLSRHADFFFCVESILSTSACWRRTVSRTVSVRSNPSLPTATSSTTRAVLFTTGRSAVSVTVYSLSLQSISAM